MANQDKYQLELIAKERKAEAEAKARMYLYTQKERKPFFTFTGKDDTDDPKEMIFSTNSLHVDLPHITQLFIDTYNKQNPSDSPVTSIDEVSKKCHLYEFQGFNPELDKFLDFFNDIGMVLYEIDPTKHYHYDMSFYYWDSIKQRMSKRESFSTELSDEEYIYLLTEQLLCQSNDSFNRLVFDRPDIARKVSDAAHVEYYNHIHIGNNPFLIIFDEVLEDAKAIDEPASVNG
jgi:hypothetical protein